MFGINFKLCIFFNVLLLSEISPLPATTPIIPIASTDSTALITIPKSRYEKGLEDYDESMNRQGRGMMDQDSDYDMDHHGDDPHGDDHHVMHEQKAVKEDPWASYYDFIINEGSFKFWATFQLVTAAILIYSAFAAVYYAKFNVIPTDYDDYDYGFRRSYNEPASSRIWSGLSSQTFQRIFDALSSKKYS